MVKAGVMAMGRCRGTRGFSPPCGGNPRRGQVLIGIILMLIGLFLIFLCIPFQIWIVLFGAALILLGYFFIRTP